VKRESKIVDGTPDKRLFWSIITDYSLDTSVCELIDNSIDIWTRNKKYRKLTISVDLDVVSRCIRISDNAGGVPESELQKLISPGATTNSPDENTIGIFGVGSKRAVVALAEIIRIRTRHNEAKSFQIDIDNSWLESPDWDMPVYEVDEISHGTTTIELNGLRFELTQDACDRLKIHLSETYAFFLLQDNFEIIFNGSELNPIVFDKWAYPPEFEPRYYIFEIAPESSKKIGVEIYGGLILDRDPVAENYGVYFYCNDRLIMKDVKDREVGYIKGYAGVPHPDASLARVIIKFSGPAKLMPWNSTKSAINYGHPTFAAIHNLLMPVISDFSSLSRRLKGSWEKEVFAYQNGDLKYLDINDVTNVKKSYLPPLPRVRKKSIDYLKENNAEVIERKPWVRGLLDSLAAQEIIGRQRLETRNRIALILLDSTFEIALKEYIVHTDGLNLCGRSLEELFKQRDAVISVVRQKIDFDSNTLRLVQHYYLMRNKLIHERATVDVTDSDVSVFRSAINECLRLLFTIES
jgi:hypothetical protein